METQGSSYRRRQLLLVGCIVLAYGCETAPRWKSNDLKAPVEAPEVTAAQSRHAATGSVSGDEDWTRMKAWDQGRSNLSQTGHLIEPAGESLAVEGRVTGVALARGGQFLVVKSNSRITVVDAERFRVVGAYPYPAERRTQRSDGCGSMHGLAVSADGATLYFTGNERTLYSATLDADGKLGQARSVELSDGKHPVNPLGIGLTPDGKTAVVALSTTAEAVVVDLATAAVRGRIPVGVCPYGVVVSADGRTAFVSNFGGPQPHRRDRTEMSAGMPVAVDERSVALRGSVSVLDLKSCKAVDEVRTGIHPEAMALSPDGTALFVADASGDGVSQIDTARRKVVRTLVTRPREDLPYGSLTTGLAVSGDGRTLFAANAGNNAVALLDLAGPPAPPRALIPAGGFPGALCVRGDELFVGNVYGYAGDVQKVRLSALPGGLEEATRKASEGFHAGAIVRSLLRAQSGVAPKPVPDRAGEPTPIKHVVYIIKENKKFDQVFGDMGRGNCEPKFCEFPRASTPNAHALADEFVLLDNYYCNGVLSCDGHQWAVQGVTSPMREKDWNNGHITYSFGIDPLAYAGCGFIWDHLLRHGVSFRNFGELDYPVIEKGHTWSDFYGAWKNKSGPAGFRCDYRLEALRKYSDLRYPGWQMAIPDQVRADAFLAALAEFERQGAMPQFMVVYLPNDHTQHGARGWPTPRAYVADNDLALGRIVEGLSRSRFWKEMVVIANEDDPQTGADHVDGHRSICMVAGPYVKRGGEVVSRFYNQSSVLHTICRVLGVPPMNQTVAMAPVMSDCFRETPDFAPYTCRPATVPLDELNPDPAKAPSKTQARLAPLTEKLDFSGPDRIDRDALLFSRFVWSTVRGDEPFPAAYAGAHGKGLKALGLRLAMTVEEDDD